MKITDIISKYKKIRHSYWSPDDYLIIDLDNNVIMRDGTFDIHISPSEIISDEWEEYKEPIKYLTHKEAMQALIDGKKICGKDYIINNYLMLDKSGFIWGPQGYDEINWKKNNKYYFLYEE